MQLQTSGKTLLAERSRAVDRCSEILETRFGMEASTSLFYKVWNQLPALYYRDCEITHFILFLSFDSLFVIIFVLFLHRPTSCESVLASSVAIYL